MLLIWYLWRARQSTSAEGSAETQNPDTFLTFMSNTMNKMKFAQTEQATSFMFIHRQ